MYLHLVLLFWNQVFTWASVIFRFLAKVARSVEAKYFCLWKRFSSSHIWRNQDNKMTRLLQKKFFFHIFLVFPIWLPIFSFFSIVKWTRIGCRNWSWLGFDTIFINRNRSRTAFTLSDPKSVKRYWWLTCIFLRFWDLRAQNLLVERGWNWHLYSAACYGYNSLVRSIYLKFLNFILSSLVEIKRDKIQRPVYKF